MSASKTKQPNRFGTNNSAKRAIEKARKKAAGDTTDREPRSEDFDDPMMGLDHTQKYRPEDARDADTALAQDAQHGASRLEDDLDSASSGKDDRFQ